MKIRILGLILLVLSLFIIQKETYIVTSPFEYPVRTGLVICYLATAVALFFKAKWFWIWGIFSFTIWGAFPTASICLRNHCYLESIRFIRQTKRWICCIWNACSFYSNLFFNLCICIASIVEQRN